MPRRESHLHGLLLVDKPGLPQVVEPAAFSIPHPSHTAAVASTPLVDKPTGALPRLYTSHDIVQLVRRWSGQRRIGHTGTLDPLASGLMVLCLGQATRLVEYYQGHDKTYLAEITLGRATDTYDAVGETTTTLPIPMLNDSLLAAAFANFRGDILQVPPIFSALKQGGESLHRKARRGEAVTVAARPVTIYELTLLAVTPPDRLSVRVRCSAGTYIRSLAHDLGAALGTCAHLSCLRRVAAGGFTLADALTLDQIETAAAADQLATQLLPAGVALDLPTLVLTMEVATRLGQGQKVPLPTDSGPADHELAATPLVKAIAADGTFLGVVRALAEPSNDSGCTLWKAEKWLAAAN